MKPWEDALAFLVGDFGQLPPVMDLPLYSSRPSSQMSDRGQTMYQFFEEAITLEQQMRQNGNSEEQVNFRQLLLRLRNGQVQEDDWKLLMTRSIAHISDASLFANAPRLFPTIEAVCEFNLVKLNSLSHPVATIKAVHSGPNASKASSVEASGLHPIVHLATGARVMLTSNLWVEMGLVNGAMGTVKAIVYTKTAPPDLPQAVMVYFDHYSGPTMHDGTVPVVPLKKTWLEGRNVLSRQQLPLKLAWAITIHKAQGLTLDKVVVDIGNREFSPGLTYVACSRVQKLDDLAFQTPVDFKRLSNLANSRYLQERKAEDARLKTLQIHEEHTARYS